MTISKIRRHLDGKVYAVHGVRHHHLFHLTGIDTGVRDVLVHHPVDRRQMWIDGYEVTVVSHDTPVDVP